MGWTLSAAVGFVHKMWWPARPKSALCLSEHGLSFFSPCVRDVQEKRETSSIILKAGTNCQIVNE